MMAVASSVIDSFGNIVDFVKHIPGWVSTAFHGIADLITAPFRAAFAAIKALWNSTLGGFKVHVPGIPGTSVGNYDISIPKLANGGIVSRPTLALIGEQGPEAVVPLSRGGGMGGVVINLSTNAVITDGRSLAQMVDTAYTEARRRGWRPQNAMH
jgi:phage-related minor tail protein